MRSYPPPSEEMKKFLVETITKLNGIERLENSSLAKFLTEKHSGRTTFNTNTIGDTFSWLNQIGVLSYDKVYEPSGGWRLHLYRACSDIDVEGLIMSNGSISVDESVPSKPEKAKSKKRCCDTPHIVKSKKTGRRKCKSCGKTHPPKKPGASASSCCNNPHPVKSRKTGKRNCKNCGKPLARKGPK